MSSYHRLCPLNDRLNDIFIPFGSNLFYFLLLFVCDVPWFVHHLNDETFVFIFGDFEETRPYLGGNWLR